LTLKGVTACVNVYNCGGKHVCACVRVRALRSETHTYAHTHVHTHLHTQIHTYTHTRTHIHTLHAVDRKMHRRVTYEYVVCVCVYECVLCMCVYVCVDVPCVRVYKWVVVCVCMNVLCMCTHIQTIQSHHQYTHHHTYECTVRVNMYVLVRERKREII